MIELPLVFLGGLLGSAHCVGMCGGFAVSIGIGSRGFGSNLRRQLIYTAGRIFTYSFFGIVAGYAGLWIAGRASLWINMQAALSHAGGCVADRPGLLASGWCRGGTGRNSREADRSASREPSSGHSSPRPSWSHVLLAGVLTGFLPCGLVYGYLALASSSASIWAGLLTMSLFGAGTGPLMILSGTGGSLISHASRGRFLKFSAVCVGLTGLISIVRGILFVQLTPAPEVVRCLFCGVSGG